MPQHAQTTCGINSVFLPEDVIRTPFCNRMCDLNGLFWLYVLNYRDCDVKDVELILFLALSSIMQIDGHPSNT